VNINETILVFKRNHLPLLQHLALKPCYDTAILHPYLQKEIYLICAVVYCWHPRNSQLRKKKLLWTVAVNVSGSCE